MKMIFKVVAATAIIFSSISLSGQDTIMLSLDSAVNYALSNNKTLLNAKYSSQKAHSKVWETTAAGLPQVSAGVDYTNYLGTEIALFGQNISFNPTSNLTLSVNQLVFSGNFIIGVQLAKLASQTTELGFQKSELDVKEQVTRAYFLVLVTERTVKIMEANKINTQLVYEKTNNLAKAGMIEKTDADKLSVMVTSIENAQKSAERQLEMAYNMLRLQLGLDAQAKFKLISSLEDLSQQNKFESALISTFNLENNFDYKLITMQEKMSQKQVSLERASYLPSLVGYYSYTNKLIKPKLDMSPNNVLGLKLSIPIFSSGMRKSKVTQAKIGLQTAENTKGLLSQQLEIQEKQLRFNLNNMLEQYQNQKKNVEIAKEIYTKMSLKYEQGVVSSLELTSANNNYLSAESNYTSMLFQLLDAELALRKLNGNL
jgi:outer membrane protein